MNALLQCPKFLMEKLINVTVPKNHFEAFTLLSTLNDQTTDLFTWVKIQIWQLSGELPTGST